MNKAFYSIDINNKNKTIEPEFDEALKEIFCSLESSTVYNYCKTNVVNEIF